MTQTARNLGMKNTTFRNASGLPDSGQVPTAIEIDTDVGMADDPLITDIQGGVDGSFQNFGWRVQVSEEDTLNNARAMDPGSITIHWTAPDLEFEHGFEDPPPP